MNESWIKCWSEVLSIWLKTNNLAETLINKIIYSINLSGWMGMLCYGIEQQ